MGCKNHRMLPLQAGTVDETMDREVALTEPDRAATTNEMGLDQANGSAEKPWVVSGDGSGSHRTIAAAIGVSEEAFESHQVSSFDSLLLAIGVLAFSAGPAAAQLPQTFQVTVDRGGGVLRRLA